MRVARRSDVEPDLVDVAFAFDDRERPAAIGRRACGRAERVELAGEVLRVAEREHVIDAADVNGRAGDHAARWDAEPIRFAPQARPGDVELVADREHGVRAVERAVDRDQPRRRWFRRPWIRLVGERERRDRDEEAQRKATHETSDTAGASRVSS